MSLNKKEQYRMLIADDEFLKDKKTHDLVWGYLQTISYLDKERIRFVYIDENMNASKIRENTGCCISVGTVRNTINLYKKMGIIRKDKVMSKDGKKEIDVYVLAGTDDVINKLIPLDTLKYLVNTATENVIKVYTYLLCKYEWKLNSGEYYQFTQKELLEHIGYANRFENSEMIKNVLTCLENNGLIEYYNTYRDNRGTPMPVKILTKVRKYYKGHKNYN